MPLIAAVLLSVVLFVLHLWQDRRQKDFVRNYRARFIQMVSQLDAVVAVVNNLGSHVARISDPRLLDFYEGNLKMLETLLLAVRKHPPFGRDSSELDPAFFLIRDLRRRTERTQKAFRKALLGKEVRMQDLYGHDGKGAGCYFCSRPVVANRFSNVKVKIDGDVKQVTSCQICRNELESTKKVKVLYFMKKGQPVHWSQIEDYLPSEDYWNINKRDVVRKTKRLELIHSEQSRPLRD